MAQNLWPRGTKYIPPMGDIDINEVLGAVILSRGLPTISVSWHCSNEYSMMNLFGSMQPIPYDVFVNAAWY